MPRAVIYKRVSTKMQVDKYSLPAQEKILKECIQRDNQQLVEVYCDAGISGERIADRPDFMRLLNDADQKKFEAVWVVDQNRLSRGDLADFAYIKKVFKDNNIQICTPYQKLTLTDIDDDFMSDLFGILGKRERLKTKQAADRGRKEKAENGKWGGRKPPFGYALDKETEHLVENSAESAIYRKIVSLFLDKGLGIGKIAKELNKLGLKTRKGEWCQQSVHYLLRNSTYKGVIVHQKFRKYETKKGKYRWHKDKSWTEIPNAHKPLISDEIFNQIQERLKKNRVHARTFLTLQLLTGFLDCPLCHNSFKVGTTGAPGYRRTVYRCKTRHDHWFHKDRPDCKIRAFGVEDYNNKVWNRLQYIGKNPGIIQKALEGTGNDNPGKIESLEKELEGVLKNIDEFHIYRENAISLRVQNRISEEEFGKQLFDLEQQHAYYKGKKRELEIKINYLKRTGSDGISYEDILRYAKFFTQSDRKLDIAQKRKLMEAFVTRIPVHEDGKFDLVLKFQIPAGNDFSEKELLQPVDSITTSSRYIGG